MIKYNCGIDNTVLKKLTLTKNYFFLFQFYSDDKDYNSEVISTHSFHTLRVARYVRIMASTGVRWIGDDEKCFRFEILGCPMTDNDEESTFEHTMDFSSEALASGFLQTSWMKPEVVIANREAIILDASHYAVDVVYKQESSEITEDFNMTNPGSVSYTHLTLPTKA